MWQLRKNYDFNSFFSTLFHIFHLHQKVSLESFQFLLMVCFPTKLFSFSKYRAASRNSNCWKCQSVESKRNILRQFWTYYFRTFNLLWEFPFTTIKTVIDIYHKEHCVRVASWVAERLKKKYYEKFKTGWG